MGRLMSDITDLRPGTYECTIYSITVVAAAPRLEPKLLGALSMVRLGVLEL